MIKQQLSILSTLAVAGHQSVDTIELDELNWIELNWIELNRSYHNSLDQSLANGVLLIIEKWFQVRLNSEDLRGHLILQRVEQVFEDRQCGHADLLRRILRLLQQENDDFVQMGARHSLEAAQHFVVVFDRRRLTVIRLDRYLQSK